MASTLKNTKMLYPLYLKASTNLTSNHLQASGIRCARAISNLVVPDLCLLFSSPPRDGSLNDTSEQYFSDLYIPSYTPSLSALTECRRSSPPIHEKPSLLLIAQPEDSLQFQA